MPLVMPTGRPGCVLPKLILLSLTLGVGACAPEPPREGPADLVLRGGAVYTMDPQRPWARAVAIADGRIVYVGDDADVAAWIGDGTEVIELGEAMLMPGFHDSHMHPMAAGTTYLRCPLDGLAWPDEVLAKLSRCAARLEDGEWLRATGLDDNILAGQGPGTALLDGLSAGHPALVTTGFNPQAWLNTAALQAAGINAATPDPAGGEIVRDPQSGEPSGVLRGDAVGPVWTLASAYPKAALREGLKRASKMANGLGITSANEASASAAHWAAYRAAERAGEMTLRVNASLRWDPLAGPEQLQAMEEMRAQADGPHFRADSVKFFLDGDGNGHSASLLEPYSGTGGFGTSNYGDDLAGLAAKVDAAGFHIHMHAYGDRAVRDGLDAIAHALEVNAPRERRHQIAHLSLVHPQDLPRFAALAVTADIQPLWAWWSDDMRRECEAFGPPRCARLLAFRDLFDSGARVVAGSDWISDAMSPLHGIQMAVTRRPPDGSGPPWNPDQRVTLEEMLKAYTLDGAWLAGQEALTGSIDVGKAADLIVLERNLFTVDPMAIKDVKVLLTLLEGEVVYDQKSTNPVPVQRFMSSPQRGSSSSESSHGSQEY